MRTQPISLSSISKLLFFLLLAASSAFANNPLVVTSSGTPYKWNTALNYTVDGGNLGALSNAQANALVAQAFGTWISVPTASVPVNPNPISIGLGPDGDISTVAEFNALFPPGPCPNTSYIIYDSDGSITDGLFGVGASNSTLGFTSPCLDLGSGSILAMASVLVVKPFVASAPSDLFRSYILGVFIHELGHGLGLGHSQVNVNCFVTLASCPSNTPGGDVFGVPTMFPVLLPLTESTNVSSQATLAADDISAISTLYSSSSFATSTGTISGTVFFGDAINHFQGANVIARRVLMADGVTPGDPRVTAVSNVSGMFAQIDHGNPALGRQPSLFGSPDFSKRGEYTIPGLPAGTYTVEVEPVDNAFIGGSTVGPQSPRKVNNFPPFGPPSLASHCIGGPGSTPGEPPVCQNLVLAAGGVLIGNNIAFRDATPTLDFFDTTARNDTIATATAPLPSSVLLSISGANDPDVDFYSANVPAGQVLTVSASAVGPIFDPVLDLMDAGGTRLTTCRIGDDITPFNHPCVDDDYVPDGNIAPTLNSKLTYSAASSGTVYVRVTDAFGDARPDFAYTLPYNLSPAQAAISFGSSVSFGSYRQFVGNTGGFTVTVTNSGSLSTTLSSPNPVTITGPGVGDYGIAAGTTCLGNVVLQPAGSCVVNMAFTPKAIGSSSATLSVFHSALGFPQVLGLLAAGTDFTIALGGDSPGLAQPSATVAAGGSADFPFFVSVIGSGGLPTTTTFSVSGLPPGAVGTFSHPSISEGASSTASVLTVKTAPRSGALPARRRFPTRMLFMYTVLCATAGFILSTVRFTQRCAGRWISTGALVAISLLFSSLSGCKGGSSVSPSGSGGGTPAVTSTITITGTAGSVSRSTTVSLTVE